MCLVLQRLTHFIFRVDLAALGLYSLAICSNLVLELNQDEPAAAAESKYEEFEFYKADSGLREREKIRSEDYLEPRRMIPVMNISAPSQPMIAHISPNVSAPCICQDP